MKSKDELWSDMTGAVKEYAQLVADDAVNFFTGRIKELEKQVISFQDTIRKMASLAASKDERIDDLNIEVVRLSNLVKAARNEGYETSRKDIEAIATTNIGLQRRIDELEAKLREAGDGKQPTGDFVVNVYDDYRVSVYFPGTGQNFTSQKNEMSLLSLSSRCLDIIRDRKGRECAEQRRQGACQHFQS